MARPRRKPVQILNVWLSDETKCMVGSFAHSSYESRAKWVADAVAEWLDDAPAKMSVPDVPMSAAGSVKFYLELPLNLSSRIVGIIGSDRPTDIAAVVTLAVEQRVRQRSAERRRAVPVC